MSTEYPSVRPTSTVLQMRTLAVAALSVPLGLLLWYFASVGLFIAIEIPDMGISRREYVSRGLANVPGLLYSSIVMVFWATKEFGAIGIPACLAVALLGAALLGRRRKP